MDGVDTAILLFLLAVAAGIVWLLRLAAMSRTAPLRALKTLAEESGAALTVSRNDRARLSARAVHPEGWSIDLARWRESDPNDIDPISRSRTIVTVPAPGASGPAAMKHTGEIADPGDLARILSAAGFAKAQDDIRLNSVSAVTADWDQSGPLHALRDSAAWSDLNSTPVGRRAILALSKGRLAVVQPRLPRKVQDLKDALAQAKRCAQALQPARRSTSSASASARAASSASVSVTSGGTTGTSRVSAGRD